MSRRAVFISDYEDPTWCHPLINRYYKKHWSAFPWSQLPTLTSLFVVCFGSLMTHRVVKLSVNDIYEGCSLYNPYLFYQHKQIQPFFLLKQKFCRCIQLYFVNWQMLEYCVCIYANDNQFNFIFYVKESISLCCSHKTLIAIKWLTGKKLTILTLLRGVSCRRILTIVVTSSERLVLSNKQQINGSFKLASHKKWNVQLCENIMLFHPAKRRLSINTNYDLWQKLSS